MPNDKLKSYLHLHLIVFIWGFTAILGKLLSIDAIPLVWYRMGLASFFIYIYIKVTKLSLKITKRQVVNYVFGGAVIAAHWVTFFYAIKISNISIALATMSTGAFFTIFIEALYKTPPFNLTRINNYWISIYTAFAPSQERGPVIDDVRINGRTVFDSILDSSNGLLKFDKLRSIHRLFSDALNDVIALI